WTFNPGREPGDAASRRHPRCFPQGLGNRSIPNGAQNMEAKSRPVKLFGVMRARVTAERCLRDEDRAPEPRGHRDQPAIHRIDGEPELCQRDHTQYRLRTWVAAYDDRRLHASAHPDTDPRHRVADLPS